MTDEKKGAAPTSEASALGALARMTAFWLAHLIHLATFNAAHAGSSIARKLSDLTSDAG
jgi:hypothetical protein